MASPVEGRALAGLGLSSIKLRRWLAGCDANLLSLLYEDYGMASAGFGDIAHDGYNSAAKIGKVANLIATTF